MTRQKRHWLCVAVLSIAILFFFGRLIQAATDGVSVSVDVTAAPSPGGFSPPPPPPPPPTVIPNVINFQAVYNGQVSVINLSWRNPPPAAFPAGYQLQAIRIIRSVTGYPISPSGNITGLIVYDAAGQATSDGNVSLETTYYYTAFVRAVGPGGAIAYASGAVAVPPVYVPLVAPPPGPPPPPPGPPAPPPSPYDIFPQVTVTDGKTGALGLGDFEFLQPDEPIKFFRGGADITIKPAM